MSPESRYVPVGRDDLAITRSYYSEAHSVLESFMVINQSLATEASRDGSLAAYKGCPDERIRVDVRLAMQLSHVPDLTVHPLMGMLGSVSVELPLWDDSSLARADFQASLAAVMGIMAVVGAASAVCVSVLIDILTGL